MLHSHSPWMTPAYKTHGGEGEGITSVARGVPELIHTPSQVPIVHFSSQLHFQQRHIAGAFTPQKLASATNQGFSLTGLLNIYQHIIAAATDTTPLSGSHARPQGHPCTAFCLLNSWDSVTEVRWLRRIVLSSVCPTRVQLSSLLLFLGLISICFPWNLSFSFLFNEPGSHLGLVQVHSLYLFFGLNCQHAIWQEPHQYDTECARFDHRNGPVDDAGEVT